MFGHNYFGASYFGPHYFGPGAGVSPTPTPIPGGGPAGISQWLGTLRRRKHDEDDETTDERRRRIFAEMGDYLDTGIEREAEVPELSELRLIQEDADDANEPAVSNSIANLSGYFAEFALLRDVENAQQRIAAARMAAQAEMLRLEAMIAAQLRDDEDAILVLLLN